MHLLINAISLNNSNPPANPQAPVSNKDFNVNALEAFLKSERSKLLNTLVAKKEDFANF